MIFIFCEEVNKEVIFATGVSFVDFLDGGARVDVWLNLDIVCLSTDVCFIGKLISFYFCSTLPSHCSTDTSYSG